MLKFLPINTTYLTDIPFGLPRDTLVGIAFGMFARLESMYEYTQLIDASCLSDWWARRTHHCSGYSNEDLPSDYLGFVAGAAEPSLSLETIVGILGGGEQLPQNDPPSEYWGSASRQEPWSCGLGYCGTNTPFNNQFTLKVYDKCTRRYMNQPWPASLTVKPIGFGVYWGESIYDFQTELRVPTPPSHYPSPNAQGTPTPPGWPTP
jgi:hypothetical protein